MKYIINRETKEHQAVDDAWQLYDKENYYIVQADSEGWIKHEGDECPLPEDVKCEYLMRSGMADITVKCAGLLDWVRNDAFYSITHYKPILGHEKVQEADAEADKKHALQLIARDDAAKLDLIGRLCVAHKHAQTIPDLEAELREVLGSMGYDLVARSPFVEAEP